MSELWNGDVFKYVFNKERENGAGVHDAKRHAKYSAALKALEDLQKENVPKPLLDLVEALVDDTWGSEY